MRGPVPPRPTGSDREAIFAQMAWDSKYAPENQLRDSSTIKWTKTSRGIFGKAVVMSGVGSSPQPGVNLSYFSFIRSYQNYTLCGFQSGAPPTTEHVRVAKDFKLRNNIAAETIYGNNVQYQYPRNVAGNALYGLYRTATIAGVGVENQGVVPQYLPNDLVLCIQLPDTTIGLQVEAQDVADNPGDGISTSTQVTWLEIGPRAWTRFANQSF
jgi:hypothetical protein